MNDQKPAIPFRARLRRILDAGAGAMAFDAFISYSHAADGRPAPSRAGGPPTVLRLAFSPSTCSQWPAGA